tara:strand:+ start:398 stop:532 length:135 start_codon:yes stop_codon:yes gene_type:complete
MSIEALIGFIISVGLATSKFNDVFDDMCKKRKKEKESPKSRVFL